MSSYLMSFARNVLFVLVGALSANTSYAQPRSGDVFWAMGNVQAVAYSSTTTVSVQALVLTDGNAFTLPIFLRWEIDGNRIRAVMLAGNRCYVEVVECTFALRPEGITPPVIAALPPLPPGEYMLEVTNSDGRLDTPANQVRSLTVAPTASSVVATSLGQRRSSKFFITASAQDVTALLALTDKTVGTNWVHPTWAIAEPITLRAWPAAGSAPDAAKEVCRLFHPVAQTHFFSGNPADCAAIRGTAPWRDEGIAFRALLPAAGGACPIGTDPVWRLFSSKFVTHRYTRSNTTYSAFQADGWSGEGVVFCSAPA